MWALTIATIAVAAEPPNAAHAIAQKFAEQSKQVKTERPPIDYEMEMLRRARAEQAAAKEVAAPALPDKTAAPVPPVATPVAVPPAAVTPAPPPSLPATSPALLQSTPAKTAESTQPTAVTPAPKTEVQAKVETNTVEPVRGPETTGVPAARASLLLALESGGASSKGGASQSFDPMICMGDTCYVSAGFEADAVKLAKSDALKLKSTSDASSDSCKGKVACVFRNIQVTKGTQIQVVEMGSASHDPIHASDLQLDPSCKMSDGDLSCDNPIATTDYRIWVVPEETAHAAGVQELEEALADGLPHIDVARATDK